MFRKSKSFGTRISLTDKQVAAIVAQCEATGLQADIDQCDTGSCYVAIHLPQWDRGLGDWYISWGDQVAKIRLSGHEEGKRQDSTHNAIGSKSEVMASLKTWLAELIAEHGATAKAIVDAGPTAEDAARFNEIERQISRRVEESRRLAAFDDLGTDTLKVSQTLWSHWTS